MASLLLTAFLSLSAAAPVKGADQITWGAVVFTYHGEKVPVLDEGPYNLTPLGANQLFSAGQTIRNRYVAAASNSSQITVSLPINGLNSSVLINSQMEVLGMTDEYVSGSALAFMQGLYPPRALVAPVINSQTKLSNGTWEQAPLNGYQYPNLESMSSLDFNYIWLAGNIGCTNYSVQRIHTLASSDFVSQAVASEGFYGNLTDSVFSGLETDIVNYANAMDLYEFALYQYNHNSTVYDSLSPGDLAELFALASKQQWAYNAPSTEAYINSIAGQTLGSKVVQQLAHNIASGGVSNKLTLMFGSYQPFVSFFALSGLSTGPAGKAFSSLPQHGSTMAFELFSNPTSDQNDSSTYPSSDELFVRFLFRNGTDDLAPMVQYPLFGRGNSEVDMTWREFVNGMSDFSLNTIADWCTSCEAVNLFCEAIEENVSNSTSDGNSVTASHNNGVSPVVAGVIGAIVTLGVGLLTGVILCLFGFRVNYRERNQKGNAGDLGVLRRSGSGNGGFKGAEKLASDTDLRLKGGAGATVIRHERVGSWELNESPKADGKHSSLDKEIESGRTAQQVNYERTSEDGIGHVNPFGDPVKPLDQV